MSRYTLDLYEIVKLSNHDIFDFDYNFYDDDLKIVFQEKFINHYMFREIGFETLLRFKHELKSKLNLIYPHYKQLYNTEIACKKIDFMLNKDLKETFTKEIIRDNNILVNNTSNDTSNTENTSINIESDTPSTPIPNLEEYMSNASKNTDNSNTVNVVKSEQTNKITGNDKEVTEFISQGNIGVTSSAELLNKWREVLINIDEMIINECSDLFLQVY